MLCGNIIPFWLVLYNMSNELIQLDAEFSENLYKRINNLIFWYDGFHPTILSTLGLNLVLISRLIVTSRKPYNSTKEYISKSSLIQNNKGPSKTWNDYYKSLQNVFDFHYSYENGIEKLILEHKQQKNLHNDQKRYSFYSCANNQDGLHPYTIYGVIGDLDNLKCNQSSYIFWNYPGVGASKNFAKSTNNIFEIAYREIKKLISKNIKAENITLEGLSFGGGISSEVAKLLYHEGSFVNLHIYQSFGVLSKVSSYIIQNLPHIRKNLLHDIEDDQYDIYEQTYNKYFSPLLAPALSAGVIGAGFINYLTGFISTLLLTSEIIIIGLPFVATAILLNVFLVCLQSAAYLIGVMLSPFTGNIGKPIFDFVENISDIRKIINAALIETASMLITTCYDYFIDPLISFALGMASLGLTLVFGLVGGLIGCCSLIQLFYREDPIALVSDATIGFFIRSSACEIKSEENIIDILHMDLPENDSRITIHHALEGDLIIPFRVSLANSIEKHLTKFKNSIFPNNKEYTCDRTSKRSVSSLSVFAHQSVKVHGEALGPITRSQSLES